MKIALLSGAVKNAGDYLITRRSYELLKYVYPSSEIKTYIRNSRLSPDNVNEINKMDTIVIAGGPCYKWDLYPDSIPLVPDLEEIKIPFFILGGGWYGNTSSDSEVHNYKFSDKSKELLKRVQHDTEVLGCRDFYSVRVLRKNGFDSGIMTGCPAWYDTNKMDTCLEMPQAIKKIAISDPADVIHYGQQSFQIARHLKLKFPQAKIICVFHRGMEADKYTDAKTSRHIALLKENLKNLQIECFDIAYGHEGFNMYDDCDLHIGHRVHAHIYNLSQRHCSILIEEDSRGTGVDEALGLWKIRAYSRKKEIGSSLWVKGYNKVFDYTKANPYCLEEVDDYIDYIVRTRGYIMNTAHSNMKNYLKVMLSHISSLERYI